MMLDAVKKISRKLSGFYGVLLLSSLFVFLWFSKGLLFGGGEEAISFYDPTRSLELFGSTWHELGTGYFLLVTLARVPLFFITHFFYELGISPVAIQAVVFFIILVLAGYFTYLLLKLCFKDAKILNPSILAGIGTLFYLCNPYTMNQVWGRGLHVQFFTLVLMPATLYLYIRFVQTKRFIPALLLALLNILFSYAYGNLAVVVTILMPATLYTAYLFIKNFRSRAELLKITILFIIFLVLWILSSMFWLLPLALQGRALLDLNITAHDNIAVLQGVSLYLPFHAVVRLMHEANFFSHPIYGTFYNNFLVQILSWLIPFIVLLGIWKARKQVRFYGFFLTLYLLGLFVSVGSNPPTGWLLIFLFKKFPILQMMRNPYEKFGLVMIVGMLPFISIGIAAIGNWFGLYSKKVQIMAMAGILIVLNVFLVWPLYTGHFAGGLIYNPWIKVPDYYAEANNWFNQQPGDSRLLHVPLNPGDGVMYTWKHIYTGIDPSEILFDKPSIARDYTYNKDYYSVLLERFGRIKVGAYQPGRAGEAKDFRSDSLAQELDKLNVKYIVLHKDINEEFVGTTTALATEEYLSTQSGIRKVRNFGQLDVYEVDMTRPQIFRSSSGDLSYKKVSPSEYIVSVKNTSTPYLLTFLMQYHPLWKAEIGGKVIKDHNQVYSYANAWNIKQTGDTTIRVFFEHDQYYRWGWIVTLGMISAAGLYLLGLGIWGIRPKP